MSGNSFGNAFRVSTFGESHGTAIGGVIEGCPAGLTFDYALVRDMMNRRRPGSSAIVSQRQEADEVEWLSGIFEGRTIGTPIGFLIRNKDSRSADYDALKDVYRPSHADYGYQHKFGIRDHRGGGRASARETAARVAAGAVAMMLLNQSGISIKAAAIAIGPHHVEFPRWVQMLKERADSATGFLDLGQNKVIEDYIHAISQEGDSTGGVVGCLIESCPTGLGEPVFGKLDATMAAAMMSIPAVKAIEFGLGFEACAMKGSEVNDPWVLDARDKPRTERNLAGGILGGISTGEDISFRVGFKPTSSIARNQTTLNSSLERVEVKISGRHDPCVVPRAVVIVEAMAALVIADYLLLNRLSHL